LGEALLVPFVTIKINAFPFFDEELLPQVGIQQGNPDFLMYNGAVWILDAPLLYSTWIAVTA
jgi:hypothetical protein